MLKFQSKIYFEKCEKKGKNNVEGDRGSSI